MYWLYCTVHRTGVKWKNHVHGRRWCWRWRSCCYIWTHWNSYSKVKSSHLKFLKLSFSNQNQTFKGHYNVELQFCFLQLQGQPNDFKIIFSSAVRVFVLAKVFSIFLNHLLFIIILWLLVLMQFDNFSWCSQTDHIHLWLLLSIHLFVKDKTCIHI